MLTTQRKGILRHRKTKSHLDGIMSTFGAENDETDRDKENEEKMNRIYNAQASIRQRYNYLKKFLKSHKNQYKSNEEFYEKNKTYLENSKIKSFEEFTNLLDEIEKEEKEEKEKEEKERKEREEREKKEKEEKEKKEKEEKERKERQEKLKERKQENINNFTINKSNIIKKYNIEHINDFNSLSNIVKKYNNSVLVSLTEIPDLCYEKINYFLEEDLMECSKINEENFIHTKEEYFQNKIKSYTELHTNKEEITGIKKIKYNENELRQSLNEVNITFEKKKSRIEAESENGLPINDLRLSKRIISKNISDSERVNKIMEEIENNNIMNKIIKYQKIPENNLFCINCYECLNPNEIDSHNEHIVLKIIDFKNDDDELDYDGRLNIIYENLKNIEKKIIKSGKINLMKYYGKLLYSLYDIIINNNSVEELYSSIINIDEKFMEEDESGTFEGFFRDLFLLFCQKICQLTYLKIKELSYTELDEGNNSDFNELEEDENNLKSIEEIIKERKNKTKT